MARQVVHTITARRQLGILNMDNCFCDRWYKFLDECNEKGITFTFKAPMDTQFWKTTQDIGEYIKLHLPLEGESPPDFLLRVCGGKCEMDCNLFNQFIAYLRIWDNSPQLYTIPLSDTSKIVRYETMDDDCFCLGLANERVRKTFDKLDFAHDNEWLYRISDDTYIGLTTDGIKELSKEEWSNTMKSELIQELLDHDRASKDINELLLMTTAVEYYSRGDCDKWDFTIRGGEIY